MNIRFFKIVLLIVLTATYVCANAQKKYISGVAEYTFSIAQGDINATTYFTIDSSATSFTTGPATVKTIISHKGDYLAVLIDVPTASLKKAGIATKAEIEEAKSQEPTFAFTPTNETKQINNFNCKKTIAKDTKSGKSYDIWVTNDISVPTNAMTRFMSEAGGVPVQFVTIQMGNVVNITLTSISDAPIPKQTFVVPADFEKITLTELKELTRGSK